MFYILYVFPLLKIKGFVTVRQTIPKSPIFVACWKQEVFPGTLFLQVVTSEIVIWKNLSISLENWTSKRAIF